MPSISCAGGADRGKNISAENALRDVEQFFFLLKYAYSGYEYHKQHTDFDQLKKRVADEVLDLSVSQISSLDLCRLLHQPLVPFINDGHAALMYADFEGEFITAYHPYATDVIVQKESDYFAVIQGQDLFQKGNLSHQSKIKGVFFPTLMPDCKDCFLIG